MWEVEELPLESDGVPRKGCHLYATDDLRSVSIRFDGHVIDIPESALLKIIGNYIRHEKVSHWEGMPDVDCLKYLINSR